MGVCYHGRVARQPLLPICRPVQARDWEREHPVIVKPRDHRSLVPPGPQEVEWERQVCYSLANPLETLVAKKKPGPPHRSAIAAPGWSASPELRAAGGLALRTIFLNLFRHNSTRLNSAKYDSGWRFTITICWREGNPVPCPAAVGHEDTSRSGHQVDIEFGLSATDMALLIRIRVDDGTLLDNFARVGLGRGYAGELGKMLRQQFGLSYPKLEDKPAD